uniref:NADH-ubiquinone oxidoreductase chain 6 n=1 Tax=Cyrtanaspis phalerata TaxID=1587452 RepID=A0A343C2V5_9CUCU|nr:NADH dehydrogenase subunit 6 [Cyrtanaspis phalerata]
MLITLFFMNMMFSLIFIFLTHPLSMGLILFIQTLFISLITGNFNFNYWFSYIIFLILIGGMLILFIYMTSIASNEKFKLNFKLLITINTIIIILLFYTYFYPSNKLNYEMIMFNNTNNLSMSMIKFLNFPYYLILTFLIMYLLFTLIAVVKITNLKKGPLRQL